MQRITLSASLHNGLVKNQKKLSKVKLNSQNILKIVWLFGCLMEQLHFNSLFS